MEQASEIKKKARELDFTACGVARAEAVDETTAQTFRRWIDEGRHGSMQYMENYLDKRLDPRLLLPGARSIIVVALNYYPAQRLSPTQLQFSYYAYGRDYHDVMKAKLRLLVETLQPLPTTPPCEGQEGGSSFLLCCDTVPILDRYWACRAGLGWIGKNNSLIIPGAGSYFFLGEIITTAAFDTYDQPMPPHCGTCERCLRACPTGALHAPHSLDARHCLSYLTIENRSDIPPQYHSALAGNIYGCDRCQQVCPHNRFAQPTTVEEFTPSPDFLAMQPDDWQHLTVEDYRRLFRGSAVKRAKYEGLMRNIQANSDIE